MLMEALLHLRRVLGDAARLAYMSSYVGCLVAFQQIAIVQLALAMTGALRASLVAFACLEMASSSRSPAACDPSW